MTLFIQTDLLQQPTMKLTRYQTLLLRKGGLHSLGGVYAQSLLFVLKHGSHVCTGCAKQLHDELDYHVMIWDGDSHVCDNCNEDIEPVYSNE